jgi:hypothetical protein
MIVAPSDEALAGLEIVAVKRIATERVHFAMIMRSTLAPAKMLGCPITLVASPVTAVCRTTLRGAVLVIPDDKLANWRRHGKICAGCLAIAQEAYDRANARADQ